jgi:hypothetical protein
MSRLAHSQPDLFAPVPKPPASTCQADLFATGLTPAPPPERPPLEQLIELLAMLLAADRLPWPDTMTAMAEERHAYWLASRTGEEGAKLVTAIMDEIERMLAAEEQEAAQQATAS